MSPTLLVIAHEATRTGSPRVLLELLRFAVPRVEAAVSVRLLAGGGLASDLRAMSSSDAPPLAPTAVFVNGAAAATELGRLAPGTATAVYVHEEGDALRVLDPSSRAMLRDRADIVCCVSENSRRDLIELGVREDRIEVLAPVVADRDRPAPEALAAARGAMGAVDGRLVIGCGEAGWRKGADLFVDVARRLSDLPDVSFAWLGSGPRAFGRLLRYDTELLGLESRLRWLGEVADVDAHLGAADLLLFPSREDPRPLAPIEAAFAGTPTVGFRIGGVAALEAAGGALACDFPDTGGLARLARGLLESPDDGARLVEMARVDAREHQSVERIGPRFVAILQRLLGSGTGGA